MASVAAPAPIAPLLRVRAASKVGLSLWDNWCGAEHGDSMVPKSATEVIHNCHKVVEYHAYFSTPPSLADWPALSCFTLTLTYDPSQLRLNANGQLFDRSFQDESKMAVHFSSSRRR